MGICSESKDIPELLCFFETDREDQKNYCIKLKDNFKHEKTIQFKINSSPGVNFCVQFKIKGELHKIQTIYDEQELDNSLKKMYQLLDDPKYN